MSGAHRVVVIGGGFGGLYAAKALGRTDVALTLVDRRNFHLFQPLLYQVATGGLSPADISSPLRAVLRKNRNAWVVLGDVTDVDPTARRVVMRDGELGYDTLIVATGARHHYFGHAEWEPLAPGLKTIEDATDMRRRILLAFESAEREMSAEQRSGWLTFVVVGGGPTGVELAGALAELARHTLRRDFRAFDPRAARIVLIEGADRVLPTFPPPLSERARRSLERLGVDVRTETVLTALDERHARVRSSGVEQRIESRTVLWGAGVRASPLGEVLHRALGCPLDRAGRVIVESDLSIPGHPEILVIGDLAHFAHQSGAPLPGIAPVAMSQGRYAARLVHRRLNGRPIQPYHYVNKGVLATIGRSAAVADFGRVRFSGFPAWVLWLFVHLMYLVEFENRLLVFVQWAYNYFTRKQGARLIAGADGSP